MKRQPRLRKAGFIALVAIPGFFLFGLLIMYLWNNVLVSVTPVKPVTYWQGLGIFVLAKILFGFGGGGGPRGGRWRGQMKEKWQAMTPEEKEKFKHDWRSRCGNWGRKESGNDPIAE